MKRWSKKAVISLIVGTFILAGLAMPFMAQAAQADGVAGPGFHQRHLDADKIAATMADVFGVAKEDILRYRAQGVRFIDLGRASFLAKAGNQPLEKVMSCKTDDNTWKDVAEALGITKEQRKATRQDIAATWLDKKLQIAKETTLSLMQQGYRPKDIVVANELAKTTGKPIEDVLSLRKINNTWQDVAESLGVDDSTFKQDIRNIKAAFPHIGRLRFTPGW